MILNWGGSSSVSASASTSPLVPQSQSQPQALQLTTPTHSVPASPAASIDGSPRSEVFYRVNNQQYCQNAISKKRKLPKWTDQVRISSENGLEGPHCDGYNWRKYGQKDIFGAKHPRSYYRCTYRNIKDCWATKQVQRSDEDPTIFEITYRGTHTCGQPIKSTANNTQESKQDNENQSNEMLQNSKNGLRANTTESFIDPATSEPSDYFLSQYQVSDVKDIVSVDAYVTTSPESLDFDFDPNFPFGTSGFFT